MEDEAAAPSGGAGWICGAPKDYDRKYTVDLAQLLAFLVETQPDAFEWLRLEDDGPARRKFLARLQGEVSKRGIIDVLRKGVKDGPHHVELFYGTPSPGNPAAAERYAQNHFSVTRQLRYSRDETQRALDLGLFINGLPVATFELKNSLTKQTVEDATDQYKRDRDPREKLFEFGRCVAHFAVDDHEVRFCTHLMGKGSWFLPFNQGWNDGAGNPPNSNGLKTDYLWKQILTRDGLTNILENYTQVVETKDEKTGKKRRKQIWPRYHQLDVVRRLLADTRRHGAGKRYLIQHSAGSGKSNSIAWLAHQLIGLRKDAAWVFDSIIVVTDRRILDQQICDTIKQFAQVGATVGHAERSANLRTFIESGKKIIISTVQKFPFILDEIGNEQRGRRFAIIIDEAHSSQTGRTSAAVSMALSEAGAAEDDETTEDAVNRIMAARQLLPNASYFAFTATPKNKTLEIFGEAYDAGGQTRHLCLLFIHPPAHGSEVSPAARNTLDSARIPRASKLLICGLFLKGRVLAQDAVVSKNTNELKTRTPPISSLVLVRGDAVRRLMETKSERGSSSGLAYSVTCLTALRRGHAAPPNRREVDDGGVSSRSAQRASGRRQWCGRCRAPERHNGLPCARGPLGWRLRWQSPHRFCLP